MPIEVVRGPDVEKAQHRIINAGLPERLAIRLREGR